MADYTELELKTFELSSRDSNSSLSVTSLALISGLPPFQYPPEELYQLIKSKQLWLISPGICRIQISVCQDHVSMASEESDGGFLEHLADAICQCSLWPVLGLTIKQEDIQYQPLYDGAPNLYFIIEHSQKSSLLLSPPQSPTARFNGVECLFRYQSNYSEVSCAASKQYDICNTDIDGSSPETTIQLEDLSTTNTSCEDEMTDNHWHNLMIDTAITRTQQQWDDAAYLAQMALHVTIGIRKRTRGLRLFQLDNRPSLLELAPAIWNAHYFEAVTSHVANFPIISNILATSPWGQSSSLRQKSTKLLIDDARSEQPEDGEEPEGELNLYQRSVQRRLWGLLQTTLKPSTGIKNVNLSDNPWKTKFTNETFGFRLMETDGLGEFGIDSANLFDGTSSDNTVFDDFPEDGRLSHGFMGYRIGDASGESDIATEYQQWWYRREDLHLGTTHTTEEAQPEDLDNHSDLNHSSSFLSQPSSRSSELLDVSPICQSFSSDLTGPIINVDNLHPSGHFHVETIHGTSNETSHKLESVPWHEDYHTMWPNEVVMGDSHCQDEDMGSQAPQMYEY
ncbi:uncharacterized protein F4807DRAFT_59751 [Annulohypoxylon truncatum]|uniref:uncharacterized protein n=1 Tax=Annulohypoxylon truncatum TaxID=327061 RepID=UPI0020077882|nr:uncharacterized protein F4807DRAFT_59751 [Annulohypoxylon truncatum]KAI1210290.1 hypothetical protein F4807DRAFT_59751 [Annulohypoxylon truncatum]